MGMNWSKWDEVEAERLLETLVQEDKFRRMIAHMMQQWLTSSAAIDVLDAAPEKLQKKREEEGVYTELFFELGRLLRRIDITIRQGKTHGSDLLEKQHERVSELEEEFFDEEEEDDDDGETIGDGLDFEIL